MPRSGPNRNDVVAEDSGWDRGAWPLARPDWSANVGVGSTSPIVAAGRLYVLGWQDGRVLWAWRKLVCLDWLTGRLLWTAPFDTIDAGSCVLAGDGRLILWTKRDDLRLVELPRASRGEPRELAHATVRCRDDVWPHVVLAGGGSTARTAGGALNGFRIDPGRPAAPGS